MIASIRALVALSSAEARGMIPSPLNFVSLRFRSMSPVSSGVITVASLFPRFRRTRFAEASNCLPSSVRSSMASSGKELAPLVRSSGSRKTVPAHCTAAMMSGTRMRPSPSTSISSRVLASISSPWVGHPSVAQSF